MSNLILPIKAGIIKSLRVLWLLTKIIVPVTCVLQALTYFNLLEPAAAYFSPITAWVGLPGEAVLPLMLGFWTNFYASLGIIGNMTLAPGQITVMALMLGICHELPIESAICSSTGLKIYQSILLRLITAILAGFLLNTLLKAVGG